MLRKELWSIHSHSDTVELLYNLYERWQMEKDYEDIQDYLLVIQKTIPEAYAITQRPFGVKCSCDDGDIHIYLKIVKNSCQILAKNC